MGEILGLGLTHYPGLMAPDAAMGGLVLRTIASGKVPAALRDPAAWPEAMKREWAGDQGAVAAAGHRRRLVEGFRRLRTALDDFAPDFVVIFGDDQYENFREDMIPPFCVFAVPEMVSRPFARAGVFFPGANIWGEANDKAFHTAGHPAGAKHLISSLLADGFDMAYAYTLRHETGLAHAFINTLLYLDYDRRGFPHPVVPFHVNCYGSSIVRNRGGIGACGDAAADPPGPSAARCFALGAAVARALVAGPWRVALIASSSWSHAFLAPRTGYLHPDIEADRARFADLRDGRLERWRDLSADAMEASGQHELLNWICLAGAMHALGRRAEIVDWVETHIFNSSKCFAVFPCS